MINTAASRETITPVVFPPGLDVHWETENRVVGNERERITEKQECCANRDVCEGTVRAKVVLTHETIAQHIGCSRETVCRTLSNFKRKGLAELVGTTLVVHDRAALECLNVSPIIGSRTRILFS
jgi:Crp-like helix-turn-helix protein